MAAHEERLQLAMEGGRYEDVAHILDQAELDSTDPDVLAADWPVALHLLGHIYNNHLEDARFLWKRLPAEQKEAPEADAVWRLLQFAWNRSYVGAWAALTGYQWSPQVQPLADALVEKMRRQMMDLIAAAYSQVSPSRAAELLGVSEAEACALAAGAGWGTADDGSLQPTPRGSGGGGGGGGGAGGGARQQELDCRKALEQLTAFMVHLES